ncbi:MAG: hypothetical protein HN855_07895 [Anaerolineae bacterium]|jgi:hypothetical protein|nr:hypothetical protein [Anaerolineae bacterium]MBT7069887.1 hypothetical protein [Anaerolineae bacterium]MBT7325063.1 hypothetical protein [Anaerolineae bacterium]
MKVRANRWIFIGLFLPMLILLTSCSGPDEHIWLKSSGWSRAVFLGNTTLNDPVTMTLDDEGQIYFVLLSSDADRTESFFDVIALDANGLPLWEQNLGEISLNRPDTPQIIWEDGHLRLFWLDNENLYTLALDTEGNPLGAATLLSADIVVGSYSVAIDDSGGHRLWFAGPRKNPGAYALSSSDGNGEIISVDPEGIRVQIRYDHENNLHVAWLQYPLGYGRSKLFYGEYTTETDINAIAPFNVHELSIGPSNALTGPVMGMDTDEIYVFWTVVMRTGLSAGGVETSYVHFPLGEPARSSLPKKISVPSDYGSSFETISGSIFNVGERVALPSVSGFRTTELEEIMPNPSQAGELAIIFRSPMQYLWRKVRDQVNMVYLAQGEPTSYQPLSFTTELSTSPNLMNSAEHDLHVTWLEKIEDNWYAVYFASTSPTISETFSHSTGRELGRVFAQVAFGMLVGILMAPIAAGILMIAPLAILFIFSPLRKYSSERVQDIFSVISILLGIVAVWMGKLAMLPDMLGYVPFSAWIPEIPFALAEILRLGVPVLFSLLAIFIAWFYTYRQSNKSTLYFILIYVGVDSALTTAIYAVLIYGAI